MKWFAFLSVGVLGALCAATRSSGQDTGYAPLQVFTNGPGRISPLHYGQMLEVWETYTMEAIPDPGFAFHGWEAVDVFIRATRMTNSTGGVTTNVETLVTSKGQFFTNPELVFVVKPVFEMIHSEVLSTVSMYGWRANFGPVREPVEPEVYRTAPGATAEEWGDRLPGGRRTVPFSATVTFNYTAAPPSVTAVIHDAVLEGGEPFPLTVQSYYGQQLTNGAYRFSGDYLRALQPTGSQYGFDWEFSASTNGALLWHGTAGWAGGHIWMLAFSNVTVLPQALLSIKQAGTATLHASWKTNFGNHALEFAHDLTGTGWSVVTNAVTVTGNRYSITLDADAAQRFYRLRKP